ncbi:hypothetical protein BS78_K143300 [Paspalum vaginatum]|uniref:Uncharacterized protein n=1 Tax=Paspalum vaginatum TaxID=158149 RepID=A0A9W8CDQ6_9POAL|nr:hypothetical protein BS78_K143300 [Paspalum vaginatum]
MPLQYIRQERREKEGTQYIGHKYMYMLDDHEEWEVEVKIFHTVMNRGQFKVAQLHQNPIRRATFAAAIGDAAIQALYRVTNHYEMELLETKYHGFPSRRLCNAEKEVNTATYVSNPMPDVDRASSSDICLRWCGGWSPG